MNLFPTVRVAAIQATAVVDARGRIVAGPLRNEEGMLLVDCDLRMGAIEKQQFDVTGHYSREDVLLEMLSHGS